MRLYLPATLALLTEALAAGTVAGPGTTAFALTPELRSNADWGGGEEELEHAVGLLAAEASLELLRTDPDAPRRRLVLALDVPDEHVDLTTEPDGVGNVALRAEAGLARVAAALVDDPAATPAVTAALADPDAGEGLDAHDLLWFAAQELPDLVAGA